jgi:glycosyltransferase involved in cell wall biosynthesis
MTAPSITVWTPVYNQGALLRRAIQSVLEQTVLPMEYIILDDASTDDSLEIAKGYEKNYPFIRVIPNDKNRGLHANFNRIFDNAQGEYLYTVAADDFIFPQAIEYFWSAAQLWPNAGLISSQLQVYNHRGQRNGLQEISHLKETCHLSSINYLKDYLMPYPAIHSVSPSTVYKASAMVEMGKYRADLGHWCDCFLHRAIGLKYGMAYIPERLHTLTAYPGSTSNNLTMTQAVHAHIAAVKLLRSSPFDQLFPQEFVEYFDRSYRGSLSMDFDSNHHTLTTDRNLLFFEAVGRGGFRNRVAGILYSLLLKLDRCVYGGSIRRFCRWIERIED